MSLRSQLGTVSDLRRVATAIDVSVTEPDRGLSLKREEKSGVEGVHIGQTLFLLREMVAGVL